MVKETIGGKQVINQPAGHVENGESLEKAIIRETQEETGWLVKPEGIIGIYPFTPEGQNSTYHRACFFCSPIKQVSQTIDEDIDEAFWLSETEITESPHRSPLVKKCIEDYKNGTILPLALFCNDYL
ncbi:NUDIX domain-containing protein [Marinomonas agarivorans]|nr:NUDIX domain-containing protein [Marinomonas agarivorans]